MGNERRREPTLDELLAELIRQGRAVLATLERLRARGELGPVRPILEKLVKETLIS